ncbi:MAG TPA: hypothetical protein VJZ78_04010 [Anaerolineales bacterium]|nr:hypothetical protein [Anaerolineales bacterium]
MIDASLEDIPTPSLLFQGSKSIVINERSFIFNAINILIIRENILVCCLMIWEVNLTREGPKQVERNLIFPNGKLATIVKFENALIK